MKLEIINELNESKTYRTKSAFKRFNVRTIADHAFMDLIATWILYNEFEFAPRAIKYASRTVQYSNFKQYRQNGTDLYLTLHILTNKKLELLDGTVCNCVAMNKIKLDTYRISRFLRSITTGSLSESQARTTLQHVERGLKIENSNYRSIRRLAQSWPTITTGRKRTALTRMLMYYRTRAPRSDVGKYLERLARNKNLEDHSAINPELKTLAKVAAAGAGAYGGFQLGRQFGKSLV